MGGNCCLSVVAMGKNGGFLPVCGVLMAVDWGKAGRFGCFYGLLRFWTLWRLRLCDSALVSRRVWRIDLQKILFGFVFFCARQCVCVRQNEFFIVVFCVMVCGVANRL